jgi:predicted nucleic acid-binding protein
MAASLPRVVLDTNVCLDLFLFGDPRCAALQADLDRGAIVAVTDPACREEWLAVLRYPALALDEARRRHAMAAFDAQVVPVEAGAGMATPNLPRCADPDDQKFLTLAANAGARWLLSRDRALLALAGRLRRAGGFAILAPAAWVQAVDARALVRSPGRGRLDVRTDQPAGPSGPCTSSAKPV